MIWQAVDTIPFRVAADVTASRAAAIRAALLKRAVPIARLMDGRVEPCATASLIADGPRIALLTAAHVFERANAGDLAVPLPLDGRVAALRSIRVRIVAHPLLDLALLWIDDRALSLRLRANWAALPLRHWCEGASVQTAVYAIAGYPSVNARRSDGCLYVKPVVVFTHALEPGRFAYCRTAQRIDGIDIHTPALDGVSGATVWAITDAVDDDISCVLKPSAIQVAFHHGRHLRGEPIGGAGELLAWRN
jgi:hypothetical protein